MTVADESGRQHAEAMDRIYRFQRHFYDLTRRYYLLGRKQMIADLAPPQGGRVLEIGCGTAWNLIEAARLYPGTEMIGVDISRAMLATAADKVRRRGLSHRIRLIEADVTELASGRTFGNERFDRVIVSYAASMIPGWRDALSNAALLTSEGGSLHIVDFGRFEGWPRLARRAMLCWLRQFKVTPRREMEPELARITARLGLDLEIRSVANGYALIAVLRRPPAAAAP